MLLKYILLLLPVLSLQSAPVLKSGVWRAELLLNDSTILPFNFISEKNEIRILNDTEELTVSDLQFSGDSVFMDILVFDSEIRAKMSDSTLNGNFINHGRLNNKVIPFRAEHGKNFRFTKNPEKPLQDISGKWKVIWGKENGESKTAIGVFKHNNDKLSGTFLTATGDYRFLEGEMSGKKIKLSAFDGSHAFLFLAELGEDGKLNGDFFSGTHHHDTWMAWRDESVELPDAETLTYLRPGYEKISFAFPDVNGDTLSFPNDDYRNKVTIIQILGSWCPNCMDESIYLREVYKEYKNFGLEIIGLDYERQTDTARAFRVIKRMKERLQIPYPVLFAGSSSKAEASKSLPMLNRIFAYPTTIYIDKKGRVRKIHTGFNGPATGKLYQQFAEETDKFIRALLAE
ncbi:MAG: TlpA family protein disulfide reductase [Bacteroidetes bacterium]|nr:MAG: TlpA family protein disulfide reductase [Bacteroidota bacterium]REK00708.1 MAG: TlpA family protein disulfide reductase [Bacteroidota bacterium]REK35170.1 MAG: TlpA family protein disulfide reductase [Bacteroidota bacterium]REK48247.1 MAG: TlpA family protein disulfide reductase [Bacteroidota bacterium]